MPNLDQIKQIKWYKQSGAGIPFLIGMPFWGIATKMFSASGFNFPDDIAIFKKDQDVPMWYHYFNLEKTKEEMQKIFKAFESNDQYFKDLEHKFQVSTNEFIKLGDEIIQISSSDPAFIQKTTQFLDTALNFWAHSLFSDLLDPFADEISKFIFGPDHKITNEQINILMNPQELSCLQQEVADILNIVKAYQSDQDTEIIDKLIKEHSQKYHWLKNDYLKAQYLDEAYFLEKVRQIASNPKELSGLRLSLQKTLENRQKQQELIKQLNLSEDQIKKLNFINWLINYRDERKRVNLISHYYLFTLLQKISLDLQFDLTLAEQILPWELTKFIKNPDKFKDELQIRRQHGLIIFSQSEKLDFTSGPEVQQFYNTLESSIKSS